MRPKLLADIQISPLTVVDLRANGYKINRVSDFISASASDAKIIELTILEKAAIITQDLELYANIYSCAEQLAIKFVNGIRW